MEKLVESNNKEKKVIIIVAIVLLVISLFFIFFSKPSLNMREFKNLPEALTPQTSKLMELKYFELGRKSENQCFNFAKSEVYELNKDLRGFFVDNINDFVLGYFKLLTLRKMLEHIVNDFPEYQNRVNDYQQKIDKIYSPLVMQYLYCMDEFNKLNSFLPDVIYKKYINKTKEDYENKYSGEFLKYKNAKNRFDEIYSFIKEKLNFCFKHYKVVFCINYDFDFSIPLLEKIKEYYSIVYGFQKVLYERRIALFKNRYPFLYNEKYNKVSAEHILEEAEIITSNKGNFRDYIHFLQFHPKAISCDSDYILKNLCCGRTVELKSNNNYYNLSFLIPKYWDLTVLKENENVLLIYNTNLDGISGGIGYYNNTSNNSEEEILKSFKDKTANLNDFLKINNFEITKSFMDKQNGKNLLVVEYKGSKNNVFVIGRTYLFLSKYSVVAYMFNVEALSFEKCSEIMVNNIPLFDGLVNAAKLSY